MCSCKAGGEEGRLWRRGGGEEGREREIEEERDRERREKTPQSL